MSKELTVNELALKIKEMQDRGLSSWKVVIPVVESSIGPSACVGVTEVSAGFDWNSGKVFLDTTEAVKRIKK